MILKIGKIHEEETIPQVSLLKMLRIPTIWFSFLAFIVATVCNGFLSVNLEPKVADFV